MRRRVILVLLFLKILSSSSLYSEMVLRVTPMMKRMEYVMMEMICGYPNIMSSGKLKFEEMNTVPVIIAPVVRIKMTFFFLRKVMIFEKF